RIGYTARMRNIFRFFDKLEDKVRHELSKRPVIYAFVAGIAIVLFWRGVWHLADEFGMTSWESLVASVVLMLMTGTFISFFVGDQILISGLREEKRIDQKTEIDLAREEERLKEIFHEIEQIQKDVSEIKRQFTAVPIKRVVKKK